MEKKKFEELIKDKTPEELHRIISMSCNDLIDLTTYQRNKCVDLKNKLLKERNSERKITKDN